MSGLERLRPGGPNIERFKFRYDPPVEGVMPEDIASLHDIVRKWGKVDKDNQLVIFRSRNIGLPFELYVKAPLDENNDSFMVSKGLMGLSTLGSPIQNGMVQWDSSLSAQQAQDAILRIDKKAQEKGLIDQETGARIALKPEDSLLRQGELLKGVVEIQFHEKGAMMIVPEGKDSQEVLNRFDQPNLLTIINHPLFGPVICRKIDECQIQLDGAAAKTVLKTRGIDIDDPNGFKSIPKEEMSNIRAEIANMSKIFKEID